MHPAFKEFLCPANRLFSKKNADTALYTSLPDAKNNLSKLFRFHADTFFKHMVSYAPCESKLIQDQRVLDQANYHLNQYK